MKVLIIEDSTEFIELAAMKVTELGHEAINPGPTKSVARALKFIRLHNPDMILLDMNYDGFHSDDRADGCKVAQELTPEQCEKIICMSGTPECYVRYLQPLGVRHFGGKSNYEACLAKTCKCL